MSFNIRPVTSYLKKEIFGNPLIQDDTLEKLYNGLTEDENPVFFFYQLMKYRTIKTLNNK